MGSPLPYCNRREILKFPLLSVIALKVPLSRIFDTYRISDTYCII